ncbi:MAG: tRNA threonylcarbamoyladenosine dehydratase, partial [Polaribacter sp.]
MSEWLSRTELLIGKSALDTLKSTHILVVGLGGVGSYAAETMVRSGVGKITIIDGDDVDITNKNRQLQALNSTIGQKKAKVLKERFLDINPNLEVIVHNKFLNPNEMQNLLTSQKF